MQNSTSGFGIVPFGYVGPLSTADFWLPMRSLWRPWMRPPPLPGIASRAGTVSGSSCERGPSSPFEIVGHKLRESKGGRRSLAARLSSRTPPANSTKVAYQSAIDTLCRRFVRSRPHLSTGKTPPVTKQTRARRPRNLRTWRPSTASCSRRRRRGPSRRRCPSRTLSGRNPTFVYFSGRARRANRMVQVRHHRVVLRAPFRSFLPGQS